MVPTPSDVCRLEFDVDFPPGHAAAYLVEADEPVLFDAGTLGSDGEADLESGLDACGYEPADVAHVVLTHFHVDHVGQVGTLREAGDPTLHAPSTFHRRLDRDLEAVRDAARTNMRLAGIPEDRIDDAIEDFLHGQDIMRDIVSPSAVDDWIEPGEPATVGPLDLDPVYTPGHDATHVCYGTTLGEERSLFSGDMLIDPFRAIVVHDGFDDGMTEGIDAYYEALDRLSTTPADRIYPGHGPVHADRDGTIGRDRATLDARVAECEAALRESGSHAVHVAASLTDDESGFSRLLPETVAALGHLERTDRARSWVEDDVRYYAPA
jgi:glyoxylase-like metal-dependent hydrolase (beta-lactamase superfamily II)